MVNVSGGIAAAVLRSLPTNPATHNPSGERGRYYLIVNKTLKPLHRQVHIPPLILPDTSTLIKRPAGRRSARRFRCGAVREGHGCFRRPIVDLQTYATAT